MADHESDGIVTVPSDGGFATGRDQKVVASGLSWGFPLSCLTLAGDAAGCSSALLEAPG